MPPGGPRDHPILDIVHYKLPVYGEEADGIIREISRLCSTRELYEWWEKEIGWTIHPGLALRKARSRFDELQTRAKESGWETD